MTAIHPSECSVSDHLAMIYDLAEVIDDCLLLGEKVSMISEAGHIYNHLRSLITPAYLTDEEFTWLKNLAIGWNKDSTEYNNQMQDSMTSEHQDNIDDLHDDIRRALDDLLGRDDEHYDLS
tara:strand:+ start:567 stop:929 length:363 start_codon:yes stop_codon:yes gene_type:complete